MLAGEQSDLKRPMEINTFKKRTMQTDECVIKYLEALTSVDARLGL